MDKFESEKEINGTQKHVLNNTIGLLDECYYIN